MTETPGLDVAGLTGLAAARSSRPRGRRPRGARDRRRHAATSPIAIDGAAHPAHAAASAARPRAVQRARHAPRAPGDLGAARHRAVPVPRAIDVVDDTAAAEVTGTVFFVMELVAGHRARPPVARTRSSPPTACAALSLELVEHPRRPARGRSRSASGSATSVAPTATSTASCRTWRRQLDASRSRDTARRSTRCRTASRERDARSGTVRDRARRLPPRQRARRRDGRRRRASRRSSTGRWRRSATRSSTSACSPSTGTSAHSRAAAGARPERGRPGRRLSGVRRAGRRLRGARRASASPTSRWYRAFAAYKLARDPRGHPLPLPAAATPWATASIGSARSSSRSPARDSAAGLG